MAANIASPVANKGTNPARVPGIRGQQANHCTQGKLPISSAVSNTAGITGENEIGESRLNWSVLNNSRPRYSQLPVRRLMTSNSPHTGAETKNSSTKFLRDRVQ